MPEFKPELSPSEQRAEQQRRSAEALLAHLKRPAERPPVEHEPVARPEGTEQTAGWTRR